MKITKPIRRKCPGKEIKFDISEINPFDWVNVNNSEFTSSEIDGYIVTKEKKITGIFLKYEYEGSINEITEELLKNLIIRNESAIKLANTLQCQFRLFLWPLNFPKNFDNNLKCIIAVKKTGTYKVIKIKDLELGIEKLRGHSFARPKNLLTATSYVECFLANKTKNPWPGDLDCVVYNKKTKLVESLVEFKTHNKDTPISEEYIGKYNQEDWRRFDVLFDLQEEITKRQKHKPNLFYVVWGTKDFPNHRKVKIDHLIGRNDFTSEYIDRPELGKLSTELFTKLTDL